MINEKTGWITRKLEGILGKNGNLLLFLLLSLDRSRIIVYNDVDVLIKKSRFNEIAETGQRL